MTASIWRLQAVGQHTYDVFMAALFLIAFTACVAAVVALLSLVAIRSIVLLPTLLGEIGLQILWLGGSVGWVIVLGMDWLTIALIALIDLVAAIGRLLHELLFKSRHELEEVEERDPIHRFAEHFPAFLYCRYPKAAVAERAVPGVITTIEAEDQTLERETIHT